MLVYVGVVSCTGVGFLGGGMGGMVIVLFLFFLYKVFMFYLTGCGFFFIFFNFSSFFFPLLFSFRKFIGDGHLETTFAVAPRLGGVQKKNPKKLVAYIQQHVMRRNVGGVFFCFCFFGGGGFC